MGQPSIQEISGGRYLVSDEGSFLFNCTFLLLAHLAALGDSYSRSTGGLSLP